MSVVLALVGALGALAAGIGLLEAAARRWLRRARYAVWPPHYRRRLTLDRQTHPQLEREIAFRVNADGERAEACPDGPGVFRILLAGGSAVECAFNDQDSTWAAHVQRLLSAPERLAALGARAVHVGNVGRSGMDMRAVDLILQRILPTYRALDLIGIMVGPGDVLRWLESGAAPDTPAAPLPVDAVFGEHPEVAAGFTPPARPALWTAVMRLRRLLARPVDRWEDAGKWMGRARAQRRQAREIRTATPDARNMLDQFEAYLRAALARAQAAAPRVVLLRQPGFRKAAYTPEEEALLWNGGIGNAYRGDTISVFHSHEVLFALVDLVEERIARVAAELGVPFVDTMPALATDMATFFDHFHLTAAGNARLGALVADALAAEATRGVREGRPAAPARAAVGPHPFHMTAPAPAGRRLLLVSYHFPPGHTAGALRWQKLAAHLAARGWGLDVITVAPPDVGSPDYRRLTDLPPGVRVFGVGRPRLAIEQLEQHLWRFYRRLRLGPASGDPDAIPDTQPGSFASDQLRWRAWRPRDWLRAFQAWLEYARDGVWAERAARAGRHLAREVRYAAVVTCGPPHVPHLAGTAIAAATGLPHVMDMRDPWSLVQRLPEAHASPLWLRRARRLEAAAVARAAVVVVNTDPFAAAMRRAYPAADGRIVTVLNGFDDERVPPTERPARFGMAYAGTIYLDRDPAPLFRATAAVVRSMGLGPDDIGIDLMGDVREYDGRSVADLARAAGLEGYVRLLPTRPRHEMLEFLARSAMLVSLPQDSDMAIPSKLYEYLLFDAWLLVLAEPGSASAVLLRGTAADVVRPSDEPALEAVIRRRFEEYRAGRHAVRLASDSRFSRRTQAERLLAAIEALDGAS